MFINLLLSAIRHASLGYVLIWHPNQRFLLIGTLATDFPYDIYSWQHSYFCDGTIIIQPVRLSSQLSNLYTCSMHIFSFHLTYIFFPHVLITQSSFTFSHHHFHFFIHLFRPLFCPCTHSFSPHFIIFVHCMPFPPFSLHTIFLTFFII